MKHQIIVRYSNRSRPQPAADGCTCATLHRGGAGGARA